MKVKLLRGVPFAEGSIIDVDPQTLLDLIACGAGEPLDVRDVARAVDDSRHLVAALERGQRAQWWARAA